MSSILLCIEGGENFRINLDNYSHCLMLAPKNRVEIQIPQLDSNIINIISKGLETVISTKDKREEIMKVILDSASNNFSKHVRFVRTPLIINPTAPASDMVTPIDEITGKFLQESGIRVYYQDIKDISGDIIDINLSNTALCLLDYMDVYYKLKPLPTSRFGLDILVPVDILPSTNVFMMTFSSLLKSLVPEIDIHIITNDGKNWNYPLSTIELMSTDKKTDSLNFNREVIVCYQIAYSLDLDQIWWNVTRLTEAVMEARTTLPKKYSSLLNYVGRERKGCSDRRSYKAIEYMTRRFRKISIDLGFAENLGTKQNKTRLTQTGKIFWKIFINMLNIETESNPYNNLAEEYEFINKCILNHIDECYKT